MSRAKWKGSYIHYNYLKKPQLPSLKIWKRNSIIPESLIGSFVSIYNGNKFKKIMITREKVGFKFGEFSFTRNLKMISEKSFKKSSKKPLKKKTS